MTDEAVYTMSFGKLYGLFAAKVERKGSSKVELDQVLSCMT